MEKLSKELAKYLAEISPHEGELTYLRDKVSDDDYDEVRKQTRLLLDLERYYMLVLSNEKTTYSFDFEAQEGEETEVNGVKVPLVSRTKKVEVPNWFLLTSDGANYFSEAKRRRTETIIKWIVGAVAAPIIAWIVTGFIALAVSFWSDQMQLFYTLESEPVLEAEAPSDNKSF